MVSPNFALSLLSSLLLLQPSSSLVISISAAVSSSSSPTLPASSLPPPSSAVKYVVLGVGTQNYTCAATPSSTSNAPVAIGAVAKLYDATQLLSTSQRAADAASNNAFTCIADRTRSNLGLRQIGRHFFTAAGTPTFDLYAVGAYLSAAKKAATPAPSGACSPSVVAEAAVPWLYLADNGAGTSKDVNKVYRVETAGGSAPATCDGQKGVFTVNYAAEYWFYNEAI